nr:hypothetical protein [uncultured Rhodopila sp.]
MSSKPTPLQRLSFIAFLDVIDRTDLLFHEIRQLQTTLIQQLGLPELFAVLRFEERFLWGDLLDDAWLANLRSETNIRSASRSLAARWTIRYPLPTDPPPPQAEPATDKLLNENHAIQRHVWDVMRVASRHGYPTQDLRRTFLMAAELQVVKQNLLREKIIVVHTALRAFGLIQSHLQPRAVELPSVRDPKRETHKERETFKEVEHARLRPLLLACWALRHQIALRVGRIGNIQRQIEQQIDVALEQDPRPSAARRRDQGIYNDAIVDRFISLQDRMAAILRKLGAANRFAVKYPGGVGRKPPVIMHRWDLQNTSRWQHEIDAIHLTEAWDPHKPPLDPRAYNALRYLNSSYWMPDRPDMQPQLAHEIAHAELADIYAGPSLSSLTGAADPFAGLLNRVNATIEDFDRSAKYRDIAWRWELTHEQIRTLLTELAADLLAAAAVGDAYLFTMALDLPGLGFEAILDGLPRVPDFDLDFEHEIFERLPRVPDPPIWFLRLHAVVGFLRAIGKKRDTPMPLAATLVKGVRDSADLLYTAFRDGASGDRKGAWDHWHQLCLTIERITEEEEGYRIAGTIQGYDDAEATIGDSGGNWAEIAELLRGPLLEREYPGSPSDRSSLEKDFAKTYLNHEPEARDVGVDNLFRWVFDVPWQFALISSLKLYPSASAENPVPKDDIAKRFLSGLHRQQWLGRHIFQLGVELWVWNTRKARIRLEVCVRVSRAILGSLRYLDANVGDARARIAASKLVAKLDNWLATRVGVLNQTPDELLQSSPRNWSHEANNDGTFADSEMLISTQISAVGALALSLSGSVLSDFDPHLRLRLAQLRDYAAWSGNQKASADDPEKELWPTLMRILGHDRDSGRGRSKIYRLERIATRAHLLPASARLEFGQSELAIFSSGQRELFASPWVDTPANRENGHWVRCLPLLGRYDLIRIEGARTVGAGKLPRMSAKSLTFDPPAEQASGRAAREGDKRGEEFDIAMSASGAPELSDRVALPFASLREYKSMECLTAAGASELRPLSLKGDLPPRAIWWDPPYAVDVALKGTAPYLGSDGRIFADCDIDSGSRVQPLDDAECDPNESFVCQTEQEYDDPFFIRQQFGLPFRRKWADAPPDSKPPEPLKPVAVQAEWNKLIDAISRCPPDKFTADRHVARSEWFVPPGEDTAIAVLSTQLAQRSARLTFMRQIAGPPENAEPPWAAFRVADPDRDDTAGDDGFIIDGWGDIICVFNIDGRETDGEYGCHLLPTVGDLVDKGSWVYNSDGNFSASALAGNLKRFHEEVARRLKDIISFKNACYDHFLVARTELAFTTFAGDAALRSMVDKDFAPPVNEPGEWDQGFHLDWSFQCRIRPDRASGLYNTNFVNQVVSWRENQAARDALTRRARRLGASGLEVHMPISLVRQAGVLDYRINITSEPDRQAAMHEMLFGENGALVDAYETLARDLCGERNISASVRKGRVFIPATALMLSSMLAGKALEAIDHRFTTLGIGGWPPPPEWNQWIASTAG